MRTPALNLVPPALLVLATAACDRDLQGSRGVEIDRGEAFEAFDLDGDDQVTELELRRGMYRYFDANNNQILDPDEFDTNFVNSWGVGDEYLRFENWDLDHDGQVREPEFDEVLQRSGLWPRWDVDRDAYLSEEELGRGLSGR